MNPIRRYVRSRLHRRIFVWFGVSIIMTIASVAALAALSKPSSWDRDIARAERFLGNQLAPIWQTPTKREDLLAGIARDFDADVIAYDATGQRIGGLGDECRRPNLRIAVPTNGSETAATAGVGAVADNAANASVGHVEVCRYRHGPRAWVFLLITGVAGACLWLASGIIARRLIRPLGRVVNVARDIGDGKLESRVRLGCRHNADELGMLARAINDMATRIEKQMSDQRELLAAVSHELRTPLGHMRLLIEILRESSGAAHRDESAASEPSSGPPARRTDRLDELEREVLEVDSLVGQLLASSRLAFDTIDRRKLDATEVATRALERAGLDDSLLDLQIRDPHFEGDATLLARALANLLDNASSHGGGVVGLRVRASDSGQGDDLLHFEVLDNGPGFVDSESEQVFDRFYRGAHRAGQSSLGLGLSLVDRIARAHGGRAAALNRSEGGARVGLTVTRSQGERDRQLTGGSGTRS